MATNIYIDAIMGSDETGDGTAQKPYKTLQYFCLNKAVRNNADYTIHLKKGTYEITNGTIFGVFASGNITIIGKDRDTEILQKAGMYSNSGGGGSINFTLTIAKLKYNIDRSLTAANLNDYKWNWNFYNVLIEYMPDNAYSIIYPIASKTVFRNCVKLTNSNAMLRATEGTIEVYDSMGYFTSGYSTSQSKWDKGGNVIGSVSDYEEVLRKGLYSWNVNRTFILHGNEYKKWIGEVPPTNGTSFLPPFNSNTTEGITVSSDGYAGTNYPYRALDKNNSTSWLSNTAPTVAVPHWLMIDLAEPAALTGYGIRVNSNWNIYTHYFQGSNDGTQFQTIHSRVSQSLSDVMTYVDFDKVTFRYVRILITHPTTSNGQVSITELELIGEGSPSQAGHWSTFSTALPNSQQFSEHGMDSLSSPLERKVVSLSPMQMSDKTDILSGEEGKVFSKNIDLKKYFDLRKITVKEVD